MAKRSLAVYGHCTIDSIAVGGRTHEQIGGSACYCALLARQFGFEARMITRFGPDFPRQYLDDNGISYSGASVSDSGTTRFSIAVEGAERTLRLAHTCDDIPYEGADGADCTIASPLCGEISDAVFSEIKRGSRFLLVDPQGFLRVREGPGGNVALRDADLDLAGAGAIKVNADEARHLTGGSGQDAMVALQKKGVENVLYTDKADISLLNGDKVYSIRLPNKSIHDTTGVGDIFCAAFCCTMVRERDFLWALCFAGGAAQAALDSKKVGVQKVPRKGAVQTNASYFYNMIKFRTI